MAKKETHPTQEEKDAEAEAQAREYGSKALGLYVELANQAIEDLDDPDDIASALLDTGVDIHVAQRVMEARDIPCRTVDASLSGTLTIHVDGVDEEVGSCTLPMHCLIYAKPHEENPQNVSILPWHRHRDENFLDVFNPIDDNGQPIEFSGNPQATGDE